jgi:hypothetical protein
MKQRKKNNQNELKNVGNSQLIFGQQTLNPCRYAKKREKKLKLGKEMKPR